MPYGLPKKNTCLTVTQTRKPLLRSLTDSSGLQGENEEARETINRWVTMRQRKIKDLIGEGVLKKDTSLY